jgi:iron complex outermembrane receptor protein
MRRCLSSLCAASVVVAHAVADESVSTTNQPMPEVVVTAARLPEETVPLEQYPANVTVLTREDIQESPSPTLPELLRQQVGLTYLDTVGFGQFGNISMRGFGERTGVLILVDGVRVNDAGDSTSPYLWNNIPLEDIERVEVIRGGASTIYGEGAIGGVINIITRKPDAKPFLARTDSAVGNLGYYSLHGDVSGRTNWFDYYVSGDRQEWDGWRDASGYRAWTALVKPGFVTPAGRFQFSYNYYDETTENPDVLTPAQFKDDPQQRGAFGPFVFENTIHRGSLDYSKQLDNWTLLGKVFGQTYDTDSNSGFGRGHIEQPNYGGTIQITWTEDVFGFANSLTFGGEAIEQDFRSTFSGGFETHADNWTASGFVQDSFSITPSLSLLAGVRYDYRHWDVKVVSPPSPNINEPKHSDTWSPKAGVSWEIIEKVSSWATVSRSFRLPSGFDIGTAGSTPNTLFFANPDIEPVEANTVEVGVRSDRWKYLGGSLAYYYSKVHDDILFDPFTFMNENFDSRKQGVELAMHSRPVTWIDFYFNTAYADATFDGGPYSGNQIPLVPQWQLSGGAHWRPFAPCTITLEAVHVQDQTSNNDLNNDFGGNEYTVLNTRADYRWRNATFYVQVNNLTDEDYQTFPTVGLNFLTFTQERRFNPAPGINFQIGTKLVF